MKAIRRRSGVPNLCAAIQAGSTLTDSGGNLPRRELDVVGRQADLHPTRTPSAYSVTPAVRDHPLLVGITATLEQKRR